MKKLSSQGISHHIILPVIVVLAVGAIGTYIYAVSHAQTPPPTSTPAVSDAKGLTGEHKLCLYADNTLCMQANGVGKTITAVSYGASAWTGTDIGNNVYRFVDGKGNCLKVNVAAGDAVIGSGRCTSVSRDEWSVSTSVPYKLKSLATGGYLGVNYPGDGNPVNVASPSTGYYWGWTKEDSITLE